MKYIISIIFVILSILLLVVIKMLPHGDLDDKSAYAVLQAVEFEKRGRSDSYIYLERGGYKLVGLLGVDRVRYWIVLNKVDSGGSFYSLPDVRFRVSCEAVDEISWGEYNNGAVFYKLKEVCEK